MFEMAHLHEDALQEYDELELCYLEAGDLMLCFFSLEQYFALDILMEYYRFCVKQGEDLLMTSKN